MQPAAVGVALNTSGLDRDSAEAACRECHTERNWKEIPFDHDKTRYPLLGKHRPAKCESCHRDYQADFVATHVRDWGATCRGCHEGTDRFTAFRHDTTDFRLVGAHVRTQCAACHTGTRTFAAFAKAPNTCAGCHREEDAHRGRFGTDCGACHNPSRWDDAEFDHTFPLNHGGETSIACATCHTEMPSFRTYTCYGCHEHAPAIIREEHLDEGIRDFRNCFECHRTGTKDEAEDRGGGREDRDRGRDRDRDDGDGGRGRGRGGRGAGGRRRQDHRSARRQAVVLDDWNALWSPTRSCRRRLRAPRSRF